MALEQVRTGETKVIKIKGQSIEGLNFVPYATASAVATALADIIDWDDIDIDIKFTYRGKDITIYKGTLEPLVKESAFLKDIYSRLEDANVLTVQTGTAKEIACSNGYVDFGGTLNVKGADCLQITVKLGSSAWHSDVDGSVSFLEVSARESIGVMTQIPVIQDWIIDPNQNREKFNLGNNVERLTFINLDALNTYIASQIFKDIELTSDKLNWKREYHELVVLRDEMFARTEDADARVQSFLLHDDVELDDCQIDFNLESSNVNSSKNHLIVRKFFQDKTMVAIAQQMANKHYNKAVAKIG